MKSFIIGGIERRLGLALKGLTPRTQIYIRITYCKLMSIIHSSLKDPWHSSNLVPTSGHYEETRIHLSLSSHASPGALVTSGGRIMLRSLHCSPTLAQHHRTSGVRDTHTLFPSVCCGRITFTLELTKKDMVSSQRMINVVDTQNPYLGFFHVPPPHFDPRNRQPTPHLFQPSTIHPS